MVKRKTEEDSGGPAKRAKLVRSESSNGKLAASRRGSRMGSATSAARRTSTRGRPVVQEVPDVPTTKTNVYVFGSGSICELGLGPKVTEVKRPRLNPLLPINEVGITKVATGGGHVLAIDHEGKLWSWGPNDSGVLARDTKETEDELDEDNSLNSRESTPAKVQGVPAQAQFVDVTATDNCSAAITVDGQVWAWGTFIDDGDKAFRPGIKYQRTPVHITSVKNAVQLAGGKEHLLILDKFGDVYSWGIGISYQLGYPVKSNLRTKTVGPSKIVGLSKVKYVACGEYHSLAIDTDGQLYGWGLNNFGQCFVPEESGNGKAVQRPTKCSSFDGKKIVCVDGGNHHSLALTENGEVYAVGETNFHQIGVPHDKLPTETVFEGDGTTPSYVYRPTMLVQGSNQEESVDLPAMKFVACGSDHSLALAKNDGSIWTWGFGEVYQLGHGKPAGEESPEDETVPTKINNTASKGVNMVWCGAGGQFSVLQGLPKQE